MERGAVDVDDVDVPRRQVEPVPEDQGRPPNEVKVEPLPPALREGPVLHQLPEETGRSRPDSYWSVPRVYTGRLRDSIWRGPIDVLARPAG